MKIRALSVFEVLTVRCAVGLAIARNSLRLPEPVASGGEGTAST